MPAEAEVAQGRSIYFKACVVGTKKKTTKGSLIWGKDWIG